MFEEVQDIFNIHRNRDGYTELKCGRGERKVCYVFIAILHLFYHYDSAPFFILILTILHLFDDINYCESAPNIYYLLSGLQEVCSEGQALQKTQRRVQGHDAGTEAAAHLWGRV